MATYTLRDDSGSEATIEATDLADAEAQAKGWVLEGDWNVDGTPVYVDVWIRDEDGDEQRRMCVVVPVPTPDCLPGEDHDWQSPYDIVGGIVDNPGVWGHGGGVVINECCMHCGCRRRTDTWAQNPSTGEQGLTEVTYEAAAYDLTEAKVGQ